MLTLIVLFSLVSFTSSVLAETVPPVTASANSGSVNYDCFGAKISSVEVQTDGIVAVTIVRANLTPAKFSLEFSIERKDSFAPTIGLQLPSWKEVVKSRKEGVLQGGKRIQRLFVLDLLNPDGELVALEPGDYRITFQLPGEFDNGFPKSFCRVPEILFTVTRGEVAP